MSSESIRNGPSSRVPRWWWLILVALPVIFFVWNSLYYVPWTVDDAFISLRYARNLVEGNGLVFNPGERIEGYSNFTWVVMAATMMWLNLPFLTLLKIVGLAAGVTTVVLAAGLAGRLGGTADGRLCSILTLWYLGCNSSLAVWCQGGLETTLFAVLILAMVMRYEMEVESGRRWPWSAVLFAIAWMTRPEAPVYALYFLVRRAMVRRRPDRKDGLWLLAFAVLVIPYEVWGRLYFGSWLPQSHAAKVDSWNWGQLRVLRQYVTAQGWGYAALLALAVAGFAARSRRLPPVLWVPLLSGLGFAVYAGFDWMPRYRHFVPIVAFQACAVSLGIAALLRRMRPHRILLIATVIAVFLAGADYGRQQLTGSYPFGGGSPYPRAGRHWDWWLEVPDKLGIRLMPIEMRGWTILGHADPGDRIVLSEIGFPGFLSMNPVWDQVGLITPIAAEFRFNTSSPEVQERFAREFLGDHAPTHIYISKGISPRILLLEQFLVRHPVLKQLYRPVDASRFGGREPTRRERILLGLPQSSIRVWVHRDVPDLTAEEIAANLERRLPDVVRAFPEYGPRAREIAASLQDLLLAE